MAILVIGCNCRNLSGWCMARRTQQGPLPIGTKSRQDPDTVRSGLRFCESSGVGWVQMCRSYQNALSSPTDTVHHNGRPLSGICLSTVLCCQSPVQCLVSTTHHLISFVAGVTMLLGGRDGSLQAHAVGPQHVGRVLPAHVEHAWWEACTAATSEMLGRSPCTGLPADLQEPTSYTLSS